MEKEIPTVKKLEVVSNRSGIVPHVLQAGSIGEILQKRRGHPVSQPAGEGTLSLDQWEVQWQEFLKTLESTPSPWGIPPLAEKPSPWEDAKAFLASFEQVAEACWWPQEEWVLRLLPALSGEAEKAFNDLDARDKEDYGKVKSAILRGDALSRDKQRQAFRCFCYLEAEGPQGAFSQLRELCHGWLRVENHSKEQILEILILEQLLSILPPEIQSHVRESGPESCSQAVALAEEFLLSQEKQVPLMEAAGSVSEAGQDPAESEWRHPSMDIREEEDGEASLLAGGTGEMTGELQRSSFLNSPFKKKYRAEGGTGEMAGELQKSLLESDKEEDSEGNLRHPDGMKKTEGNDTDEKMDKSTAAQGGGFHEIPVQEESPTANGRNEGLCSNQEVHCSEKGKEKMALEKISIQITNVVSQEQILSGEKPYNCSECGKRFRRRTALISHQRIHSEDDEQSEKDEEVRGLSSGKIKNQELVLILERNFKKQDKASVQEGSHQVEKRDQPHLPQGRDFHEAIHVAEEMYKCLECDLDFSDQRQYNNHLRKHHGKSIPKCLWCGKSFSCRSELLRHQIIHTAGKQYRCSSCGRRFSRKVSLIHHQRTHSEEKPFPCSGNGKNVSDEKKGNVHFPKHNRMMAYKCFQCGKFFRSKSQLLVHQRHHTGEKHFKCSECGKKFSQRGHLEKHCRIHTRGKPFECSEYGKSFNWSVNLQRHQRTHTRKKPFECSQCGKKFGTSFNLQRHERTHTGDKPFECSDCGKRFIQNFHLQEHLRIHTGEKPFQCSRCGKKFSWSSCLHRHERNHIGEKSFECSECGKSFYWVGDLNRHQRSHSGEKPFLCSECGKCFKRLFHLQRHQRTHTNEKEL